MAYVNILTSENGIDLEKQINKAIKGKSINDFTIQFKALEYSGSSDIVGSNFERFYTALIIFKDEPIKTKTMKLSHEYHSNK